MTERVLIYELIDGAAQTVAVYATREAAEAHVTDDESLEVVERTVWPEYVPEPRGFSWRD